MPKYTIDDLVVIFADHARKWELQQLNDLENFPYADWVKQGFNVSEALLAICRAISKLEEKD
jgi:hypothetical protein